MKKRTVPLFIGDQFVSLLVVAVLLFWTAGRTGWWQAWAAIGVWVAYFVTTDYILLRTNPELIAERLKPPRSAKKWDRAIVSILRLTQLVRYIVAGLELRYSWTNGFPLWVQITGLVMSILGQGLFGWAMVSNAFFSQVVRIQSDRGHAVVTQGPYRFLRHPSYLGGMVFDLGLGFLLGSWWALLAGGVCAVLFIIRTVLEDRTLQIELPGYQEYARKVRYRLLPGIW